MRNNYIKELDAHDQSHFWFKAKTMYLQMVIRDGPEKILDIGCGAGGCLKPFIQRGASVWGIDKSSVSLRLCKKKGYNVINADLQAEKTFDFLDFFPDYITLLDFLEHVDNPVDILKKLKKIARSDTELIITVPAYNFLYSDWDKALNHVKRYNQKTIRNELSSAGWEIKSMTHIHVLPLIPALIGRMIIKPIIKKIQPYRTHTPTFFAPGKMMNQFLYALYYVEFFLIRMKVKIPVGLSLMVMAIPKKNDLFDD